MAQMNLFTSQKTDSEIILWARGWGKRMGWESEVGRCKLLHLEWINNKVLLYSTRNYIQSPGINHNGREYYKKRLYMCKTESLHCIADIDTTL